MQKDAPNVNDSTQGRFSQPNKTAVRRSCLGTATSARSIVNATLIGSLATGGVAHFFTKRLQNAGCYVRVSIAGGTNLVDLMKEGVEQPDRLVDIYRLEHTGIEEHDGGMRLGALATTGDK
jgi:FAD binding domain in molybdopterin dehydrogenase